MEQLLRALLALPEAREAAQALREGPCAVAITGLAPIHRSQMAAALSLAAGKPPVVLCADEGECARMAEDLRSLTGREVLTIPARELYHAAGAVTSREFDLQRLAALCALLEGWEGPVVATVEAMLQRTGTREALLGAVRTLEVGERFDLEALARDLAAAGYTRCDQVEGVGQFALRGGILDVFSPGMDQPVRCDFFDDEIDAMGVFDTLTQRRLRNVDQVRLLPVTELLGEARSSVFSLMGEGRALFLCESGRLAERVKGVLWQAREDTESLLERGEGVDLTALLLREREWEEALEAASLCMMDALPTSRYPVAPTALLSVTAKQLSAYGGSLDAAEGDLRHYRESGTAVLLLCGSQQRGINLHRVLEERGIPATLDFALSAMPAPGQVTIAVGALSAGAEWPQLGLAVLTEGQLTAPVSGRKGRPRLHRSDSSRQRLQSYTDLTPGDLVVHAHHGIGRFVGMQRMPVDGVEKDYIKIAYAGRDVLYVPATSLDLVSKYIGGGGEPEEGGRPVKLSKLGGADWQKQKTRAKAAAKDLARGLIALYAQRQRQPGFAFSPDSPWQQEFEAAFPYEETDDQLRCVSEIKGDMERPVPMDRLLCGDVGYGKTEVAFRAIMKCVLDGKQAAVLVPTTVLAQQHYATAKSRFRGFPVEIRVLSRFQAGNAAKKILYDLKAGRVDVLIGTHRLLQKDVQFKDLGLLIVDEEQRFGVSHKEKLKEMSSQVDVLTLSATPIPRTLNMALSGIRDMSALEEPPRNRQPVQTYVLEHDWGVLRDAMARELGRGGQVYYLHNRVEDIDRLAARIHEMLGEDTAVAVAHGKMSQQQLSAVMEQMVAGEVQVLVCTTIIETGIDIPNVNTLIIEDADHYGLSQLHQIRGRIGRSARRSYAYLTYRRGKVLSEVATKRLTAIKEYVEFGSGFKIAMRDLEIRGAGNLLGPEQSGYMMSVGYDMYLQLLEEAVLEEKGERKPAVTECSADLTLSANIPEKYVPAPEQRMDLYRRIAAVRTGDDASDLLDELIDRYGEPPRSVRALLDVALLRAAAAQVGVTDITQRGDALRFTLTVLQVESVVKVCGLGKYRQRLTLSAGETPAITLRLRKGEAVLSAALELVEDLKLQQESAQGESARS